MMRYHKIYEILNQPQAQTYHIYEKFIKKLIFNKMLLLFNYKLNIFLNLSKQKPIDFN